MKLLFRLALLFSATTMQAQTGIEYYNTPFSGVQGMKYNPAEMVDSRYKFHMNLFGVGLDAANDFVGFHNQYTSPTNQPKVNDTNRLFYMPETLNGKTKQGFVMMDIPTLSAFYNINPKNSIGIISGVKTLVSVGGVSELGGRFALNRNDQSTWTSSNSPNFYATAASWAYAGIAYGRELINKKKNYLKAGITVKGNFGLGAIAMNSDNLYLNVYNKDTIASAGGLLNTNYSSALYSNGKFNNPGFSLNNLGFGLDFGLIYERRDGVDYSYNMDCRTDNIRHDLNKYKYRIGVSVTDLGSVPFNTSIPISSVKFDSSLFQYNNFKAVGKPYDNQAFYDSLRNKAGTAIDTNAKNFTIWTPTALNVFVDYRVWKGFYVAANATTYFSLSNSTPAKISNTFFTLTPRIEGKVAGLYIPIQYRTLSQDFMVGAGVRLLFMNLSVADLLWPLHIKTYTKSYGIKLTFNIPILQKGLPRDDDEDLISNKLDKCPNIPGDCDNLGCAAPDDDQDGVPNKEDKCPNVKGPLETAGCPDTDGDGIIDKDDQCPKQKGPKEYYGCPDTDGDGLPDNKDNCPKEVGPKDLDGCPDRDGDKVPDNVDKCPDTAGLRAFDGCPEVKELPKDMDGDGIPDEEDKCPEEAGPKSNKGCPVDIAKETAKFAQESLEFKTGSAVIKTVSYSSLNLVAKVLRENPNMKVKLHGHTDNVGKPEKNLKLSKDRAYAVKEYFMKKRVAGDRIETDGFGMTQPIGDNDTEAGRQLNRRVEIEIIK